MRTVLHIKAPVETVFEFFKDPSKAEGLIAPMEIRELKMTEQGTGTYTNYHTKFGGIPFNAFSVYTDVVPNQHITEKSSSAMVGTWDYDFEPEGTGTRLTMEHHSRSFWNLPPLRNLGDVVATRMNEKYMRRVADRIETSAV
jgi:uncharacterized protein YndB with AHSA1/START domain